MTLAAACAHAGSGTPGGGRAALRESDGPAPARGPRSGTGSSPRGAASAGQDGDREQALPAVPGGGLEFTVRGGVGQCEYFRRPGELAAAGPVTAHERDAPGAAYGIAFTPELTREPELEHNVTVISGGPLT